MKDSRRWGTKRVFLGWSLEDDGTYTWRFRWFNRAWAWTGMR